MRSRILIALGSLFAGALLLGAPSFVQAQGAVKTCSNTCKQRMERCQKSFKDQAQIATEACRATYKASKPACRGDTVCKDTIRARFDGCMESARQIKARKRLCAKDADGFTSCKACCKKGDLASCPPPACGDGQTWGSEECDNGPANSDTTSDACRTTCERPACGDRVTDLERGEECDDGNLVDGDGCDVNCTETRCGNSVLTPPETCDNGSNNSDTTPDACRTTCEPAHCGDRVTDSDEECDDGDANSDTTPDACRTTCERPTCPDNVVDPSNGEACDGNDQICASGRCRNNCTCKPITCPDDAKDPGEECDGPDDSACACRGSCLDCLCFDDFDQLAFTTVAPGGNCGRINDDPAGTGTDLTPYGASLPQLDCGTLYIGGGASVQPPSPTPDEATSRFKLACGDPTALVLSATTSAETGSNQSCTSPGCFFGPPLPIPNSGSPGASTCVINSIAAAPPVRGTLDAVMGMSTTTLPLTVVVRVAGDLQSDTPGIQPCPTCTDGTCDSGSNSGGPCTTATSLLTSHDCPLARLTLDPFGVDLSPLATGVAMKTAPLGNGDFCGFPDTQRSRGAFGQPTAEFIETRGSKAGDMTTGAPRAATQSSVFCIPRSGSTLVDSVADLAGPGAVTLKGSTVLQ